MSRVARMLLILIPLSLVLATVGVWIGRMIRPPHDPPAVPIHVETRSIDGITFEIELNEGAHVITSPGEHSLRFTRREDVLDYSFGLLTVNDIGMPEVNPGDTVRWNLHGPLLINDQPREPHPLQPSLLEANSTDALWTPLPSAFPRDTLSVAWAGATRLLVVAHGDGAIRIWDVDKAEVLRTMTPEAPPEGGRGNHGLRIAVSPNGKQIAATNTFGEEVTLWDLEKGEKTAAFKEPKGKVTAVGFADDKSLLEARGGKLLLRPIGGSGISEIGTVHDQFEEPFAIHIRTGIAAWNDGKTLRVGPIANPAAAVEGEQSSSSGCIAFSADGSLLAAFNGDNRLSLLDPKTGKEVKRLRWRGRLGNADGINALAFSPDGKTLAVGSGDSIRFYDVPTGRERGGLASPWVRSLAYSADGRTLAAGLRYLPGLRLWNAADLVANPQWNAGTAKAVITPETAVWLAGYGTKRVPDGKLHDLWMKALALEDHRGSRVVLVTSDNQGMPKEMTDRVFAQLKARYGLERTQVMITFSHNHCGPRLGSDLIDYYPVEAEQEKLVAEYTAKMEARLVEMVGEALRNLAPAALATGKGRATFAVNRRSNTEADVPALLAKGEALKGPVDHDVPVLTIANSDGKLAAVLFGYACHPTTLNFTKWCGDYPGFAQIEIEKNHPGALAMFVNTCGGDQNPLPRRSLELCEKYGRLLAAAVEETMKQPLTTIPPGVKTAFESVELPYEKVMTREDLQSAAKDPNAIRKRWAERMLKKLDAGEKFNPSYPYPLHAWRLGDKMLLIGMGAETVVDYALNFKAEYGADTWVLGYADDMIAYIPSRRVWQEGGYEGGSNLYEYGRPALRWSGEVEPLIAKTVAKLVKSLEK